MLKGKRSSKRNPFILALSGGADSVYLMHLGRNNLHGNLACHYNHKARGRASDADQHFVERICADWGLPLEIGVAGPMKDNFHIGRERRQASSRFEEQARETRYAFLKYLMKKHKIEKILVAHTADDQVETVLMRILEGAGIAGLKGIPRKTSDGIERPILDVWREDILKYLYRHKIPFRVDKSNFDTRFERNWIRHVLIPLLEKRYGKSVKKRIFALGERFREIDRYIEESARKWIARNVRQEKVQASSGGRKASPTAVVFPRKRFGKLPSELRIRILQILCFEKANIAPNERVLASMDRLFCTGKPSARLSAGKGAILECRYDEAVFRISQMSPQPASRRRSETPAIGFRMDGPGRYSLAQFSNRSAGKAPTDLREIAWGERKKMTPARLRTVCRGERSAVFDRILLETPLSVRPLRAGDRVQPFGMGGEKKVKEILIGRKVPREERWGRPVVCDARGAILWVPGVVRSAHAPVSSKTDRTVLLRISDRKA